ncbi:MAG TPA: choice-of-anchor M domain-containing protein [Methylomirabilota bacterium]|nr:choice-of-anchor M domain-containing protein [Methylomirabilota bacterium]
MKAHLIQSRLTLLGLLTASVATLSAQTSLTTEHVDVGIAYEQGAWDLHLHKENPPPNEEFEPGDAILVVGSAAETSVPASPSFSFLGTTGDPVWILPQNQNPSLLFLGIGAEEIDPSTFVGNITLTLDAVSGPGHFALYQTDSFGTPTVFMNSRDGISSGDNVSITPGNHAHFNWAFSEPGTYNVAFEASGILNDGFSTFTSSGPVTYTYEVVPEPGTYALLGLGAGMLFFTLKRRARRG